MGSNTFRPKMYLTTSEGTIGLTMKWPLHKHKQRKQLKHEIKVFRVKVNAKKCDQVASVQKKEKVSSSCSS